MNAKDEYKRWIQRWAQKMDTKDEYKGWTERWIKKMDMQNWTQRNGQRKTDPHCKIYYGR